MAPAMAFTAYDCNSQSNKVESYSLLEPDACPALDGSEEIETAVHGEIVQMKMVPRCQLIETIMSQNSSTGHRQVNGYMRFKESLCTRVLVVQAGESRWCSSTGRRAGGG